MKRKLTTIGVILLAIIGFSVQTSGLSQAQAQTKPAASKQLLLVSVMPSGDVVCLSCSQIIKLTVQVQPSGQTVSCVVTDNFGQTFASGQVRNQATMSIKVAPAPQTWLSQYINNGLKKVTLTTTCSNAKFSGYANTILYLNRKS